MSRTALDTDTVHLHQDGWLSQLLRALRPELAAVSGAVQTVAMSRDEFELWTTEIVDGLPFGFDDFDHFDHPLLGGPGRYLLLAGLADMARLATMAVAISGGSHEETLLLDVAMLLAALVTETEAMREIGAIRDDVLRGESDVEARIEALKGPMTLVGKRLLRHRLDDQHPLLGRPFHRILTHAEARATAHLARQLAQGQLDEPTAEAEFARNMVYRTTVIEAVIALACIDGRVDRMEQRLIMSLIAMARIDAQDVERLHEVLASGEGATVEELVQTIDDPADRHELLKMVIFAALVDDELSPLEEDFYDGLAVELGIECEERVAIFGEVARAVAHHPGLIEGLKPDVLLSRTRRSATRHVEEWVVRNAKKVGTEVKETGQLLSLLARWTHEDLSAEERAQISDQILDIFRSAPALALFAAPGGSLLIPVLAKVLPFSIAPSSFKEEEQDLT